jgi:hypothetical protein
MIKLPELILRNIGNEGQMNYARRVALERQQAVLKACL